MAADALPDHGGPDAGAATHRFRKITLSKDFFCEGASYGDFDRDGALDVVSGPYVYRGPDFATRIELYTPKAFDPKSYSDCFLVFVHDMSGDGWDDVLIVGYPGKDASWLENPTTTGGAWIRHRAFDVVDDESPDFVDLTGDGRPELVLATGSRLGWAEPSPTDPRKPWAFHPLSPPAGFQAFTHGLGVGDLDGDGRADVLEARGWWRQPASLAGDPTWTLHAQQLGSGGAQMLVSDVDDDGDGDVITSLAAHDYGISWFEQGGDGGQPLVEHVIVSSDPSNVDVVIHQPHALALHDIDGDGKDDIVAGERFWGHVPAGAPDFAAPARLYWLEHTRDAAGVRFAPHLIDDASGVGTQVVVGDVTADGLPDVVVASKKGAFVFVHELGMP